jgi:hypothetical protein
VGLQRVHENVKEPPVFVAVETTAEGAAGMAGKLTFVAMS